VTRAQWFTETLVIDDELDPFAAPIEEVGERVDLRDPQAADELRLHELLRREGVLFANGVSCPIKDRPDTTCHACPVSRAHDKEAELGALCRVGREQESVLTRLAAARCQAG
jgi:hypothetical protein